MENTLFVSDLDGTLLDSNARLSEHSRDLLNSLIERGLRFTYATARSHTSALPTVAGLSLREPVLAYNGALMVSPDGKQVYHATALWYEEIRDVLGALMAGGYYPLVHTLTAGKNRVAWLAGKETAGIRQYVADRAGDKRLHSVESLDTLFAGDILNLSIIGEQEWVAEAYRVVEGHPLLALYLQQDTYHPEEYWLEIQHRDATKAEGIRKLQQKLSLPRVACFGDNHNDLPMFQAADASYAVSNAVPELKAAATDVIGPNTGDGVARFLQGWFDASENP